MEEELEIILRAVDEASDTFQGVSDSVSDMSSSFEEVGSSTSEASEGIDGVSESGEGAGESIDGMAAAADAFTATALLDFAQQVSDTLWGLADSAGTVRDSMDRASLEAEGFGLSAESMKGTLSDVADETGRAGGQIRESFIKATARGVTDMDSFKTMMEGAGAQAYLLGTDIQSMGNKFSSMAQKDTLMSRALAETGVTMAELATAMGMTGATADEVKAKWKELDTNQRAAILGTAASMNEGKDANEHYKNSWEGLQAQVDKAKAKLEVMVGNVLLPVLIPALQAAGKILNWFGDTLNAVMSGPLGGIISVFGSLAAVIAIAVPAIAALSAAWGFYTVAISPAIAATWALISPLLPFIAIGAAIVLIIYEIGKAFGWWTDASSMIDAIGAGLQRLWSAFINHPDVQAAIQAITSALQWLWNGIVQAGQAILEFFGVATGGEFDIVRALIEGIGYAWQAITLPIRTVISLFQMLWSAGEQTADIFSGFWNDTLAPFGEWLSGVFAPVWQLIGDLINAITPFITNLSNAFTLFANGQMSLPDLIWNVLVTLATMYITIWTRILTIVAQFGSRMVSQGISMASRFVTGIITRVSQLPGQVGNRIRSVVSVITSGVHAWISAAVSGVSSLVSQVVGRFSSLPGQISSALGGVVSAITSPFQSAYNSVVGLVDNIKQKVQEGLSEAAKLTGFGGDSAWGGDIVSETVTSNSGLTLEHNLNINLSLDAPSHMNTEQLGEILSDKGFIRELVNNRDFQVLDSQAKERLNLKINRSRGI